ncbi:MAG: flagellar motor switch protein FliM [Gammaproteobacteria bacterium]|nr:flagellar motor switch protein FliM [Gammaproteobacteria bacterium]
MDDLLSQAEVDALLSGMDGGDVETDSGLGFEMEGGVSAFDFTTQERIIRGRMPTLEMIAERFARNHRITLFNLLRKTVEIGVVGINVVKFSEYLRNLFLPTSLNLVKMHPFRGTALITFDPKLVFSAVDYYFGGLGKFAFRIEGREFTVVENRVINILLERLFEDMAPAWEMVEPIEFESVGHEVNPQFANIVGPTDPVVVMEMSVDLEGVGGEVHMVIPYSMLDSVREKLESGTQTEGDLDDRWLEALHHEVEAINVELSCELTEVSMAVSDVMKMEEGDIIPIEMPESVLLRIQDVPVVRGRLGSHDGCKAVRIAEGVQVPDLIMDIHKNKKSHKKDG